MKKSSFVRLTVKYHSYWTVQNPLRHMGNICLRIFKTFDLYPLTEGDISRFQYGKRKNIITFE